MNIYQRACKNSNVSVIFQILLAADHAFYLFWVQDYALYLITINMVLPLVAGNFYLG